MQDFKDMVREMVAQGIAIEDIARQISETFNEVQEEKNAQVSGRKKTLDNMETQFHKHYKEEHLTISDAAALCVLVCADSYPDWGEDEIAEFFSAMQKNIRTTASITGKNPIDALFSLIEDLKGDNKREEKQPAKPKATDAPNSSTSTSTSRRGSDRKAQPKDPFEEDLAAIKKFLETLK